MLGVDSLITREICSTIRERILRPIDVEVDNRELHRKMTILKLWSNVKINQPIKIL